MQVKHGLASARYPVELVESFRKVVREDLRDNEELSDVVAFSAGPSPHEDFLTKDAFVHDVRGGLLEIERVKQARREEVQWCRGMGVWAPVLRKDMDAEGALAVSLRWVDGMLPLESVKGVRHQPCALSWSAGAPSVCGTPR